MVFGFRVNEVAVVFCPVCVNKLFIVNLLKACFCWLYNTFGNGVNVLQLSATLSYLTKAFMA